MKCIYVIFWTFWDLTGTGYTPLSLNGGQVLQNVFGFHERKSFEITCREVYILGQTVNLNFTICIMLDISANISQNSMSCDVISQ